MNLSIAIRELHPRRTFRIARARRKAVENVFVRLECDGVAGFGEASPNAFYDETAEGVSTKLEAAADFIRTLDVASVSDIERAWSDAWTVLQPSRAAQCALDLALWDWLARKHGVSVSELAWGRPPQPVVTFCTIGLSSPEELAEKVDELAGFPRIKIKSDAAADLTPVRYVRERCPSAMLAVDANCAWAAADVVRLSEELRQLGAEFIEQPFPPADDERLPLSGVRLPVMADESCVTEEHVPCVAARFDGFNIKLVKCGGLTPALRMAREGKRLQRKMMVGCMLESSLLIAAGAVAAQETDYVDLDGAWLLGDDPVRGWQFANGILSPPDGVKGLGAEPEGVKFPD